MPKAVNPFTSPGLPGSLPVDVRPNPAQESIGGTSGPNGQTNGPLVRSEGVPVSSNGQRPSPQVAHVLTGDEHALLREAYAGSRGDKTAAIDQIVAAHPGYKRRSVARRGARLRAGAGNKRCHRKWNVEDIDRLRSLRGSSLKDIARNLERTLAAIRAQVARMGETVLFFGGFKTKDLVFDLRVEAQDVERWIRNKWLRRRNGQIPEEAVHEFFKNHPEEIPFDRLEPAIQHWLKPKM